MRKQAGVWNIRYIYGASMDGAWVAKITPEFLDTAFLSWHRKVWDDMVVVYIPIALGRKMAYIRWSSLDSGIRFRN